MGVSFFSAFLGRKSNFFSHSPLDSFRLLSLLPFLSQIITSKSDLISIGYKRERKFCPLHPGIKLSFYSERDFRIS